MQTKGIHISQANDTKQGILKGIPSSPGISIGKARIYKADNLTAQANRLPKKKIPQEIERYKSAIAVLVSEFTELLEKVKDESRNISAIIESNLLILSDTIVQDSIIERIKDGYYAENAVIKEFDVQKSYFTKTRDEILRERAIELDHIKKRLLSVMRSQCIVYNIARDAIVVAHSLTPSDVINFKDVGVLAFVTELGGIASHVSIMARSFAIPTVIGVRDATEIIREDTTLIVDAYTGQLIYNPKKTAISKFIARRNQQTSQKEKIGKLAELPTKTTDGVSIELLANIDSIEDVHMSIMSGAEGLGLVRTESLLLRESEIPDEETQYLWYKQIAESAYPKEVTLRVFDLGSDKFNVGMPHDEENPAIGFRGIRYLLSKTDIFATQLRAILRASSNKNINIMLPMISSIPEIISSRALLNRVKEELLREGFSIDEKIKLGIMIETPAAALMAESYGSECDFFSIGTNDLTQFTLAADRNNDFVSDIFDSFHPAVLKLVKMAVDGAKSNDIPVSICGELAAHTASTSLLIGMGVRQLSIAPPLVLELKNRILSLSYEEAVKSTEMILALKTINEVHSKLQQELVEAII